MRSFLGWGRDLCEEKAKKFKAKSTSELEVSPPPGMWGGEWPLEPREAVPLRSCALEQVTRGSQVKGSSRHKSSKLSPLASLLGASHDQTYWKPQNKGTH